MYVPPTHGRKKNSSAILHELEKWAKELGFSKSVLETGKGQHEAISFYKKAGYIVTDNYGPYVGVENSICMKKEL